MLAGVLDANEGRDVMPDIKSGEEGVMMKIAGALVNMPSVELNATLCGPHVVCEKKSKALHAGALKPVCGMLEAALLWHKEFWHELEQQGFMFDPRDPSVANREKKGSQHAFLSHVDDLKSSHKNPKVNDHFEKQSQDDCGQHGKVANHCPADDMIGDFHNEPLQGKKFRKFHDMILGC